MFPYQLAKCELLTEAFGESKVFETIRQLRETGYFPANSHVTINDLCVLIYCLSCSSKVSQTKDYLSKYFLLKDTGNTSLVDGFITILSDKILLHSIDQVCYVKESGKVIISFKQTGNQVGLFTTGEDYPDTGVSTYTMIDGQWWVKLHAYATKANLEIAATQNVN